MHLYKKGFHVIAMLKTNRILYPNDIAVQAKQLARSIEPDDTLRWVVPPQPECDRGHGFAPFSFKIPHLKRKMVARSHPLKGLPSNAVFHPTIETVGFQTAFSVNFNRISNIPSSFHNDAIEKRRPIVFWRHLFPSILPAHIDRIGKRLPDFDAAKVVVRNGLTS
ncbi:hypothetical protein C1N76_05205 [Geobacillus thermoleovorans]|uniref:Uncharacterized protein n=3 Tax=Anoxybacillaceae TaxID=3120669 RepID=A0A2Z3N4X3_GEOTH|nr:hypothetical protein C1N76_05205 [Geobacillus thermoleovorans]OQP09679.1 hypothetical protein B1692_16825 [Geobacillus thermoleovorans]TLS31788.1 hypothetical protein FDK15_17070 [Geobacillus thermoleovorans]